jgi:hypothetical protein
MPESVISSELDLFEDFDFPHTPCREFQGSRSQTQIEGRRRSMVHSNCGVPPPQSEKCSLDSSLILVIDLPSPMRSMTWVDCGP